MKNGKRHLLTEAGWVLHQSVTADDDPCGNAAVFLFKFVLGLYW